MPYVPINLSWLGQAKPQFYQNYPMAVNAPSTIERGQLAEEVRHNREGEKGAAAQRALYSRQLGIQQAADEALDRYRQGKLAEEERKEQQALFDELGKATARQDWPRVLAIGEEINRRGYGKFETGPGFGAQEEGQGQRLLAEPSAGTVAP